MIPKLSTIGPRNTEKPMGIFEQKKIKFKLKFNFLIL